MNSDSHQIAHVLWGLPEVIGYKTFLSYYKNHRSIIAKYRIFIKISRFCSWYPKSSPISLPPIFCLFAPGSTPSGSGRHAEFYSEIQPTIQSLSTVTISGDTWRSWQFETGVSVTPPSVSIFAMTLATCSELRA